MENGHYRGNDSGAPPHIPGTFFCRARPFPPSCQCRRSVVPNILRIRCGEHLYSSHDYSKLCPFLSIQNAVHETSLPLHMALEIFSSTARRYYKVHRYYGGTCQHHISKNCWGRNVIADQMNANDVACQSAWTCRCCCFGDFSPSSSP